MEPGQNVRSSIPILASLNLDQTEDFCVRVMGWVLRARYDDYLIFERGACEVHYWLCADEAIPRNTACYVRLADVDAEWRRISAVGYAVALPEDRPWGMREMGVLDPHGNLWRLGQAVVVAEKTP